MGELPGVLSGNLEFDMRVSVELETAQCSQQPPQNPNVQLLLACFCADWTRCCSSESFKGAQLSFSRQKVQQMKHFKLKYETKKKKKKTLAKFLLLPSSSPVVPGGHPRTHSHTALSPPLPH